MSALTVAGLVYLLFPIAAVVMFFATGGITGFYYRNRKDFRKPRMLHEHTLHYAETKCWPHKHLFETVRRTGAYEYTHCVKCGARRATQFAWRYEPRDDHWLETGEFALKRKNDTTTIERAARGE